LYLTLSGMNMERVLLGTRRAAKVLGLRDRANTSILPSDRLVAAVLPRVRNDRRMAAMTAHLSAALAVLVALSLLVAACGGGAARDGVASLGNPNTTTTRGSSSPAATGPGAGSQSFSAGGAGGSPSGGGQSSSASIAGGSYNQALKFSQCMRSHGLPDFPDPGANGAIQFSSSNGITPGSPQFDAAQKACRKFMPNKGAQLSPAQQAKALAQALKFSQCMRAHGIADFPDPQAGNGGIGIRIKAGPGSNLNPNNPQFQAAQAACQKAGGGLGRASGPVSKAA